jgi:membrane-associated phospholipid phosphatase
MAVLIFLFRRTLFGRYTFTVVGTMYLGLLLFFLVPTTPPWLAGVQGDLNGAFRVMDFVGGEVHASTYRRAYASLGEPNSVAAMPSIHMGVTFAMLLWSLTHARRWVLPLVFYNLIMAFSLVYLAEHYVLDLIVGVFCATLAWVVSRRLIRLPPALEHSSVSR